MQIYNGNRTEWSTIQSVIIQVINKIGWMPSWSPICQLWVWFQTELDDMKSCYQLIKTITWFDKEIRHWLYVLENLRKRIKKKPVNLVKWETTVPAHEAFGPLTQAWCVNCPFNCPIMPSNNKHDMHTVILVLKLGGW